MESSPESWHHFARRLEEIGLLGAGDLGRVDAHLGRGEAVRCSVACGVETLQQIGLRKASSSGVARVRSSFLTRMRRFWVRQNDHRYSVSLGTPYKVSYTGNIKSNHQ